MNQLLKYCLYAVVLVVGYHLVLYAIDKAWYVNPFMVLGVYAIAAILMMIRGFAYRKAAGGLISFRKAVQIVFPIVLVAILASVVIGLGLFYFDAELLELLKSDMKYMADQQLAAEVIKEKVYQEQIEYINNYTYRSFLGNLQWIPFRIIFGFIFAAVVALLIKR